ncbi:3-beta hydroxysteroid dehydrogenase [Lysobacter helvus]|uniref:3-beta hydroxysteroid dehydrogenase n=2 Tax=Lysobacteraceae TaxID=32033 RepID=A0ABN6FNP9_9GAMM|nr:MULTISPECIES: NAD(P)-dependent oxidoreductase [Lysobacter]BCT91166.1 3-beta hydroxysteroid dehydrogenase [Lysobacter caseinilyticus]BCT94319.1 3-beta hydroxysteroid dehydrogenase [Lysobacter helvus]
MARVLVTGASGFIGAHVVAALRARGHAVVASGRNAAKLPRPAPGVDVRIADLACDPMAPLLAGCDTVVHAAALSAPWGASADFQRANVLATQRVARASLDAGVRRFVHLGSPSIYFRFEDQYEVREEFAAPARWITPYAQSKWASEQVVRAIAAEGLPAIVLRPRAVFGPGDNAILPRLLAVAARGWFPLIHGGRAVVDVTCVDNVAALVADAIDADVPGDGRAYNITNGDPIEVRTLVSLLFDALDMRVRRVAIPRGLAVPLAAVSERIARLRPGCPEPRLTRYGVGVLGYSQTLDIARARRELAYSPGTSIAEGIASFAHWWRRQHA